MGAGTALAVVTVALAALAVAQGLPDGDDTAAGDAQARPSASATGPGEDAGDRVSATPDPAPTPRQARPPARWRRARSLRQAALDADGACA